MSTPKSQSRKRKHESISKDDVSFKLSTPTTGKVGPVLVSYPALEPPPSTPFSYYVRKKAMEDGTTNATTTKANRRKANKSNVEDDILVVGETDAVEFVSNEEESKRAAQGGCRYLVSVYDRTTGSVMVLPTAKTPHILTRSVKKLKSIPPAPVPTPSALEYKKARTLLGETFGTKKAKAAIRARERNRIDVGAMEGVMDFVMEGIEKATSGLPTKDEAREIADRNRLIPPFSAAATVPEDIYPLHDIIPETEWKLLSINALEQAGSEKDRVSLLFYRKSYWINEHVERLTKESGKGKKRSLKLLLYISAMLMFHQVTLLKRMARGRVAALMASVPEPIVDSLFMRFLEAERGSSEHQTTPRSKILLLTHIFALCLKVDNFVTDTSVIAHDLSMSVASVNQLFKTLGCKISTLNAQQLSSLGLPQSAAATKRAILSAPVKFPPSRARGSRRR